MAGEPARSLEAGWEPGYGRTGYGRPGSCQVRRGMEVLPGYGGTGSCQVTWGTGYGDPG